MIFHQKPLYSANIDMFSLNLTVQDMSIGIRIIYMKEHHKTDEKKLNTCGQYEIYRINNVEQAKKVIWRIDDHI